jgi:hypothetical protein
MERNKRVFGLPLLSVAISFAWSWSSSRVIPRGMRWPLEWSVMATYSYPRAAVAAAIDPTVSMPSLYTVCI